MRNLLAAFFVVSALGLLTQPSDAQPSNSQPSSAQPSNFAGPITTEPDGVTLSLAGATTRLQIISPTIIRVTVKRPGAPSHPSIAVLPPPTPFSAWKLSRTPGAVILTSARLKARLDTSTGAVTFADAATGKPILVEAGRAISPAIVQGEQTYSVQQQWKASSGESLFGLGQQQLGILDLKGYDLDLWQHNTNVVVPFLVSSGGYGIFWNNTSFTRFGDLRPFVPIPAYSLLDQKGTPGGLTLTYPGPANLGSANPGPANPGSANPSPATPGSATPGPATPGPANPGSATQPVSTSDLAMTFHSSKAAPRAAAMEWNGAILAPVTGDYQLRATFNGGLKVWVDGKLVIDHWLQTWLTADNQVKLPFIAGRRYTIRMLTDPEQQTRMSLLWKTPAPSPDTSLWSEVGDGVDYYFVYGPGLNDVVAGYRTLTGKATMMPSWIFGLWQSRQRYETAQASLDVVKEFRRREIPFDNIVQDWQYWKPDSWGSHEFDHSRFPDPEAWIKDIHQLHANLMISVWGKFNPNTANARDMQAHGFLYQPDLDVHMKDWIGFPYTFYDAFNPAARKLFWSQMETQLFRKGIDAWWMDASEPDLLPGEPPAAVEDAKTYMNPTAMGTGARMLSGWGLMNANSIYTGQRGAAPNQRVFILTRSGYAGQQRYATATWSGDVTTTWTALAKQIPAGLGISIAGVPYWTTDTAGYTMQEKFQAHPDAARNPADEDEFRELNARWFEFSTFTPMLRVHGELRPREMWLLGGDTSAVYKAEVKFDQIRYRLFPYLYSLAGAVTQHDGTIMRPLVMDFPADALARTLTDEFLFGPSLLVAPVLHYKERSREVYLPGATPWYNFWTGEIASASHLTVDAPYDQIPLFVRAGSILPLGPEIQYTNEKPGAPITLHVFEGANGQFTLYEDQGATYDYEKGAFTEIAIAWNEASRTLTIGPRQGSFPGMPLHRTFQIVITSPSTPTAFSLNPTPVKTVEYDGTPIKVTLP